MRTILSPPSNVNRNQGYVVKLPLQLICGRDLSIFRNLVPEILKYSREAHLKARQTEKRIHHVVLYENLYERRIG
jgi:hypothetical protein